MTMSVAMSSVTTCLVFCLCFCATYGIECPDGWTTYQNSCYYHGPDTKTYNDAEAVCKSIQPGSTLVHVNSPEEQNFLHSYLTPFTASSHWIGLNDVETEGTYLWTDQVTSDFLSWGAKQPDNHNNADCAVISRHLHYHWADSVCSNLHNPLCELGLLLK